MIGVPVMANSRRVMKVEKPRPLKISSMGEQSLETVLSEMDLVAQKLNANSLDRTTYTQIASLCENLKMFGPQLESVYKDQLDRCYVALRNGCRDDHLSLSARYRLLEVIELRAMNWQPNENLINYYKQKLSEIEMEEASVEDPYGGTNLNGYITAGTIVTTPTTPIQQTVFPGQYPAYPTTQQIPYPIQPPPPIQQQPPPPPPPSQIVTGQIAVLAPGEIMKSSGKFVNPIRVPGKNQCKDEIVIRNADSGKVMGLKGRRVHMIEELSETVISFQRVAPGARERLVQITGMNEDNLNQAKQLIEDTIRRNASPIRADDRLPIMSHGSSCSSISSHASDETLQGSKRTSLSGGALEESVGEYRYSVTKDSDTIRITGSNLELVRTAKLILDEYFNGDKKDPTSSTHLLDTEPSTTSARLSRKESSTKLTSALTSAEKSSSVEKTSAEEDTPDAPKNGVVTVLRQPLIPSSSKKMIESVESGGNQESSKSRRMMFAKTIVERYSLQHGDDANSSSNATSTSSSFNNSSINSATSSFASSFTGSTTTAPSRLYYSRDFLVRCAASPVSRSAPANWPQIVRLIPYIVKKDPHPVIPSVVLARELRWSSLRTTSVAEDEDTNGNPAPTVATPTATAITSTTSISTATATTSATSTTSATTSSTPTATSTATATSTRTSTVTPTAVATATSTASSTTPPASSSSAPAPSTPTSPSDAKANVSSTTTANPP